MRFALLIVLFASAAALGCLQADSGPDSPEVGEESGSDVGSSETGTEGVTAPELANGTAFVYARDGPTAPAGSLRIVLASTEETDLLAGASGPDLVGEIVHDRAFLGPVNEAMNPEGVRLFDWPLEEGKTWALTADGFEVSAERARVPGPDGEVEGFEIRGERGNASLAYTYAPSVGFLTSYRLLAGQEPVVELKLEEVTTEDEATWFEQAGQRKACSAWAPDSLKMLEVAEGADAVVAGGWSSRSGTGVLEPPPESDREPVVQRHEGGGRWIYDLVEAEPGTWTLATKSQVPADAGGGRVCLDARAVTWTSVGM